MKLDKEKIFDKIKQSSVLSEPFDHLIVDNLLPDEFYKNLTTELDREKFASNYIKGPYGDPGRYGVDFTNYHAWLYHRKRIPTRLHMNNYSSLIFSKNENIKTFIDFFIQYENEFYLSLCSKIPTERSQDNYFFHISMNKDSVGYKIPLHTDNKENIYTILFYAPKTDINKQFGLHMKTKKIDFMPNRMIIFAPAKPKDSRKTTWHEVKLLTNELSGTRNSFQMFFYKNFN